MTKAFKNAPICAIIVFLVALISYTQSREKHDLAADKSNTIETQHTIDMTLSTVRVQQFNAQGVLTHELSTPYVMRHQRTQDYDIQAPDCRMVDPQHPTYHLHAQEAKLTHDYLHLFFNQHVELKQEAFASQPASQLTTASLHYALKDHRIDTHDWIFWTQPPQTLRAHGLSLNLDTQQLELFHPRIQYAIPVV